MYPWNRSSHAHWTVWAEKTSESAHRRIIIKTSRRKLQSPYFIHLCCVIFMHDWQELQLAKSANCQLKGCNGTWHLLWCWWEMESKMTVMTGNWVSCEPVGKCGLNRRVPLHKTCLRRTRETPWSCYGPCATRAYNLPLPVSHPFHPSVKPTDCLYCLFLSLIRSHTPPVCVFGWCVNTALAS